MKYIIFTHQLALNNCKDCPFLNNDFEDGYSCNFSGNDKKNIPHTDFYKDESIPELCKLNDFEIKDIEQQPGVRAFNKSVYDEVIDAILSWELNLPTSTPSGATVMRIHWTKKEAEDVIIDLADKILLERDMETARQKINKLKLELAEMEKQKLNRRV